MWVGLCEAYDLAGWLSGKDVVVRNGNETKGNNNDVDGLNCSKINYNLSHVVLEGKSRCRHPMKIAKSIVL